MTLTKSSDKRGGFMAVFTWQLKRTMPAAILYWALMAVVTLWDWFMGHGFADNVRAMEILITCFAVLMPIIHLNDCFSRKHADYIHALPIPRGQFYLAALINSMWQLILPIIPCRLYTTWVTNWKFLYIEGGYHIRTLVMISIALLGFTFMAAAACGTYHGYIIGIITHMAAWLLLVEMVQLWINSIVPGANTHSRYMPVFRFLFAPFGIEIMGGYDNEVRTIILLWLPILGALCSAAGYILYKRRRSEQAGHFGQCRPAELFLRTELTFTAGVIGTNTMAAIARDCKMGGLGIPFTLLCMPLALILAYIVLELIWHRNLKSMKSSAVTLVKAAIALAVTTGVISTGLGLDTAVPEVSQIRIADVHCYYPMNNTGMRGYWNIEVEDDIVDLRNIVHSPQMLDKVHELHEKYIELERAAQYPYLPGRSAYEQIEEDLISYNLYKNEEYVRGYINYRGPLNAKTEPIYEELKALRLEIAASDEYVNSIPYLNAIDAVSAVDSLENIEDGSGVCWGRLYEVNDPRPVEEFPKDFLKGLEAAMREDFKACRYSTVSGVQKADYPVYELSYDGEFTARGGVLWLNREMKYVPAEGMRLKLLTHDDDGGKEGVFRVTKEMPATYAYLCENYK